MQVRNTKDGSESRDTGFRLLTVRQAASEMNICTRSVWRLLSECRLKSVRIGRAVRVTRESIDKFVETGGAR